ncbi:MAG: hypothetical protein PHY90_10335 [Desulfitobacteriaceae bacterium]|nr:hypothetical protein [Desulfitobacteriaceae bacterium]
MGGLGRGMMMSEEEADYFLQNELWLKDEGILGNAGRIWDRKSLVGQGVGALVAKDMGIVKDIGNIEAETVTKKAAQSNKIDAYISRAGSNGEMSSEEQAIYDKAVEKWQNDKRYRADYDNYLGVYGNKKDVNKTDIAIKQQAIEHAYALVKKRAMLAVKEFRKEKELKEADAGLVSTAVGSPRAFNETESEIGVKSFAKMLHNTSFDKLYHMGQDYVREYENRYKEDESNAVHYKDIAYEYLKKYHDLNGYTSESFEEKASELTERYRRNKTASEVLESIKERGELDPLSNLGSHANNDSPAAVLPVSFNDSPNDTSGSEIGSGDIRGTVNDSNITSDASVAIEKIRGMRSYDLGGDFFDAITGDSYGKLDFSQPAQVKAYEEYYKADDINIPLYKDKATKIAESYFSKVENYNQEDFDKKVFQTIEKYRQEKAARFALKYSGGERSAPDPYKIMEFRDNRIGALNRADKLLDFENYSKPSHLNVDNLDPSVKEKYDMYYGDDAKNYMKYYEVADDYVDKYYRKNGWKEDRLKVKREELIENYRKNKALKFAMNITSGRVLAEGFATGGKTNDNVYGFSNVNKTIDPDSIQKQVVNRGRGDYGKVDVSGVRDGIDNVVVSVSNGKESIVKNEWLDNLTPYVAGGLGTSHITNEDVLGLAAGKRATGGVVGKNGIKGFKNTGSPGRAKTTFDFGMGSDIVSTDNSSESILKEILETAKEQTSILASAFGAGAEKEDEKSEWEKIKANSQKIIDASKPSQNVDADSIVLAIEKASKFISINLIKHSIEKDGDKPQQIKLVDVKESNYGQDVINGKPDYTTSSTNYDVAVNPHEEAKKYAERFAPRVSQPLATIHPQVGNAQPPNPAGSDGGKGNSTQVFGEVEVKSNVVVTVVPNEEGLKTYVVKVIEQSPTAIGKALLSGSKN